MIESIKEIAAQTEEQIISNAENTMYQTEKHNGWATHRDALRALYKDAYAKGVIEQRDFTNKANESLLSIIAEHVESAFRDFEVARACNGVGHDDNQKWLLVWSELDEVLRDCREAAVAARR